MLAVVNEATNHLVPPSREFVDWAVPPGWAADGAATPAEHGIELKLVHPTTGRAPDGWEGGRDGREVRGP